VKVFSSVNIRTVAESKVIEDDADPNVRTIQMDMFSHSHNVHFSKTDIHQKVDNAHANGARLTNCNNSTALEFDNCKLLQTLSVQHSYASQNMASEGKNSGAAAQKDNNHDVVTSGTLQDGIGSCAKINNICTNTSISTRNVGRRAI